jgi:hypothetical protein
MSGSTSDVRALRVSIPYIETRIGNRKTYTPRGAKKCWSRKVLPLTNCIVVLLFDEIGKHDQQICEIYDSISGVPE